MALLEVRNLEVSFLTDDGVVKSVDGISYSVEAGRSLGIVGESGSGKSVSSLTLLGLTRAGNARFSGEVLFEGRDLLTMSEGELRKIRGEEIAMIFQDPLSSLHPFHRIGDQLAEAVRTHHDVSKHAAQRPGGGDAAAWSASRTRAAGSTPTRTSSRAACASGR